MSGSLLLPRPAPSVRGLLFNGNAFCQVAGLVDVGALEHCGMVGKGIEDLELTVPGLAIAGEPLIDYSTCFNAPLRSLDTDR